MPLSTADNAYLHELGSLVELHDKDKQLRPDRTGVQTYSRFGVVTAYDLTDGKVPLLGSKSVGFKTICHELIWMLKGDRSLKYLIDNGVSLWNNWVVPGSEVYKDGKLVDAVVSALYPTAWRNWESIKELSKEEYESYKERLEAKGLSHRITKMVACGDSVYVHETVDQIKDIINTLKTNPTSRRILLSAWDPTRNDDVILPACHPFFQLYLEEDGTLTGMFYMRSSDHFLGKPFNLVQYALLTHILAHLSGYKAGKLISVVGDQHLYSNHVEVARKQLSGSVDIMRAAPDDQDPFITLSHDFTDIDQLDISHITLHDYIPGPKYEAPVAV